MKTLILIMLLLSQCEKVSEEVNEKVFVCSGNYRVVHSTYHKYMMIDNKHLIHLGSCNNPTHKKL